MARPAPRAAFTADPSLQAACKMGNVQTVTALLRAAAADGSLEQVLLQTDSNDGLTPLGWAARNGQYDIAQLLLAHMPERQVLHASALCHNALSVAAMQGHAGLCEQLLRFVPEQQLAQAPDADCPCCSRNTALISAAANGHSEVVKVLLVHIPERQVLHQNQDGVSALFAAVWCNSPDVVAVLLQYAAAQQVSLKNGQQYTVLHLAASKGDVTIMQQLLAAHDPVQQVLCTDGNGCMPVQLATMQGHTGAVRCLLAHSPEQQLDHQDPLGGTVMLHAAKDAKIEILRLLLSYDGDAARLLQWTGSNRVTLLMRSAGCGCAATVQVLLQHSPDWQVQQVDAAGRNALVYSLAAEGEDASLEVVRLLLRHSPEVQVQQITALGVNALMLSLSRPWDCISWELLKHCPALQLAVTCPRGMSPLCVAVSGGKAALIQEMLKHITDPAALATGLMGVTNIPWEGFAAATIASVARLHTRCCQLLLDAGADPTTLTPQQLAAFKQARPALQKLVRDACERRWKEQRQAQELQDKAQQAAAALLADEEEDRAKAQAVQAKKDKKKQKKATARAQKAAAQAETGGQEGGSRAGEEDGSVAAAAEGVSNAGPSRSSGGAAASTGAGSGSSYGGSIVGGVSSGANGSVSALMETVAGADARSLPLATQPVSSSNAECDRWCVVCLERHSCRALVPCGHIVMCGPCCEAVQAAKNECPMCRERILAVLAINTANL